MHRYSGRTGNTYLNDKGRMFLNRYAFFGKHHINAKHIGTRRDTTEYPSYFVGLWRDIVKTIQSSISMPLGA